MSDDRPRAVERRQFDRASALERAANYINRAENALEYVSGPTRHTADPEDAADALPLAAAAAAIASALIAYVEADGPPRPMLE